MKPRPCFETVDDSFLVQLARYGSIDNDQTPRGSGGEDVNYVAVERHDDQSSSGLDGPSGLRVVLSALMLIGSEPPGSLAMTSPANHVTAPAPPPLLRGLTTTWRKVLVSSNSERDGAHRKLFSS
ncbi:hypothetical protein EYF80_065449 [Liparis tanakae]|uniref:Uncharacterized protein n=1 Tax=Liparis tanakae TaxID=230148 RepID=A0A4Z2E678_9TELE|nr:hypothetical protein EYF80_065449 [Liparis tanakae]